MRSCSEGVAAAHAAAHRVNQNSFAFRVPPAADLARDAGRHNHREGNDDDRPLRALCNLFS